MSPVTFCGFCPSAGVLDLSSVATVTVLKHSGQLFHRMLINLDLSPKHHDVSCLPGAAQVMLWPGCAVSGDAGRPCDLRWGSQP